MFIINQCLRERERERNSHNDKERKSQVISWPQSNHKKIIFVSTSSFSWYRCSLEVVFPFKHGRNDRSSSIWIFWIHLIFNFLSDFGVVGWFIKGLLWCFGSVFGWKWVKKKIRILGQHFTLDFSITIVVDEF